MTGRYEPDSEGRCKACRHEDKTHTYGHLGCDCCLTEHRRRKHARSGNQQQNPDSSWSPAQPLGWQEEHGRIQQAILWLLGREHCNEREGQKRSRLVRSGPHAGGDAL